MSSPGFDENQHPRDNKGQFARTVTEEGPPITVDNVYRDDEGTFRYPPVPPTAAQMTHFWCNVEVPEDLMGRFQRAYGEMVDDEKQQEINKWDAANPRPREDDVRATNAWNQSRQHAWERVEQAYRTKYMPIAFVRPLARVERMWRYSRYLPQEEQAKFNAQRWPMPGGAAKTASEWVSEYQLHKVGRALDAHADADEVESNHRLYQIASQLRDLRFLDQYGEISPEPLK